MTSRRIKDKIMTMKDIFQIDRTNAVDEIHAGLSESFSGLAEDSGADSLILCDSFDWRLFKANFILQKTKQQLAAIDLAAETAVCSLEKKGLSLPCFWWDLPDSELRKVLKPILDIRAAVVLVTVNVTTTSFNLRNRDEKTVARMVLRQMSVADPSGRLTTLALQPVRGYNREYQQAEKIVKKTEGVSRLRENQWIKLLKICGFAPGDYTKKPDFYLTPEMTSAQAVKLILDSLLHIMKANEEGIKRDIDTEFLHDFRVSVRKARSLLTQIKDVFTEDITAGFKNDLKTVGKHTNQLRDFDVYLLDESNYRQMLPERLRSGLTPLFALLKRKRRREASQIAAYLASAEYKAVVDEIETFCVSETPSAGGVQAETPVIDTARRVISRRFKVIRKKGAVITEEAPEEAFHELRIECKKLRYLLEFFQSLFPPTDINTLIKQLKQLQDNLGRFNDLSVQQAFLYEKLENVSPANQQAVSYAASLGALISALHREQAVVRQSFFKVFAGFAARKNKALYKKLFT